MLTNSGFTPTAQTTEILIYFSNPNIYIVDTAFIEVSSTNHTQVAITTKTFDNDTNYYSASIKQSLQPNTTYSFVLIIKKNPNNDRDTNFAVFPQNLTVWVSNYYYNNFIPFTGLITDVNFDLENLKQTEMDDFSARYESYVILIIFCCIAFGFLVAFVVFNVIEIKKRNNKIQFQPVPKVKPEEENNPNPKEVEMPTVHHD